MFELDNGTTGANAIDEPTNAGPPSGADDWAQNNFPNTLNNCPAGVNSCGYVAGPNVDPANPGGSAFRSLFIQDPNGVGSNDDIFTGGGSKDDLDVSQWQWTTGSPPDKDDLLPIGAAAYLEDIDADNEDELLIYLFGTLFAPNGSAAVGAWLFKKNIGTCANGKFGVVDSNGNCLANQPAELHTIGDVFVVSETTNGGRAVQMQVFKWVGSNAAAKAACVADGFTLESPQNSLCKVLDEANALCSTGLVDDDACGSMNLGTIKQGGTTIPGFPTESPDDWGFQSKFPPKSGPANPPGTDGIGNDDFPETSLFEAGFNFSNLFPNEIGCFNSFLMNTRTSHSVRAQLKDLALGNFPLCGISVDKTGPEKSKVGDDVTYSYTITNTGAITLYRKSIVDDVVGDLTAASGASCAQLAPQASCTFDVDYTVQAGDPDPLVNTVNVVYNSAQNLQGDDQSATDDHSVNLFQPEISLAKTGDALSKVGDPVNYQITLSNSSSHDTPDLVCTIIDPLVGIDTQVTLASGAEHVIDAVYIVQEGDLDPLPNTATASCSPEGFPNVLEADASHSVELFQPSVTIDKSGTELSKVGDDVDYVITVSNTSSADSPDLECTVSDALLGIDEAVTLASGEDHVINASRTVQEGDPDPLPNTASVTCSPQGFPNVLEASDSHSVELFQPSIALTKTGDELSKVGDLVNYEITLSNTSSVDSPDLECTVSDPLLGISEPVTLASGEGHVINASRTVQEGDPDPLPNTASASCSPIGFPNVLEASASHIVELFQPSVAIDKSAVCEAVAVGEDITYSYTISNTSSPDSPALNLVSIVDDKLGDLSADATGAGCDALAAGDSCNFSRVVSTSGGLPGTLTNTVDVLYNPAGFPNEITASDSQDCEIVLPNPATVVIEKILQNAENLAFDYSATNLSVANFSLTPLFGALPLANSPFAAPAANEGFATTIELTVEIPDVNQTEDASVTEDDPLPAFVNFVSLECAAATDGTLTGPVVIVDKTATLTLGSGDFAFCRYVNAFNPGDEGCTPGFWKQEHHFGHWLPTGYLPDTVLNTVFTFPANGPIASLGGDTMLQALNYMGGNNTKGAAQILLRAAVAAVLNAAHPDVQFAFTEGDVIADVNAALNSGSRATMLALATTLDNANNGVTIDNGGTESCSLSGRLFL
ncbi:hypothetical protein [Pseudomonas sp.]|uniref:DUF7507 domain-containing protein n=1 Tax=Pseudomonas sp. TaxID=306 RepID=UPI0035698F61